MNEIEEEEDDDQTNGDIYSIEKENIKHLLKKTFSNDKIKHLLSKIQQVSD